MSVIKANDCHLADPGSIPVITHNNNNHNCTICANMLSSRDTGEVNLMITRQSNWNKLKSVPAVEGLIRQDKMATEKKCLHASTEIRITITCEM